MASSDLRSSARPRGANALAFEFNPGQDGALDLMSGEQLHTCVVGGARSGKTFGICYSILVRAIRAAESRHLIARSRYNHVKASVWHDTLPKVRRLCFPDLRWTEFKSDGFIRLRNGSEIWFGGLDEKERVDKILGQEYATIFANECSQIPYASVVVLRTRLAQKVAGLRLRGYYDLNPSGSAHWTNKEFGLHVSPLTGQAVPDPENFRRIFINPEQNSRNLPPETLAMLRNLPGRYGLRFYRGEYTPEIDGALWTMEVIDAARELRRDDAAPTELPPMIRKVIAIDPSGTRGKGDKRSNSVGIIAMGRGQNNHGYVFEDATSDEGPQGWGERAVRAFREHKADAIVGETNFGGDMVRHVIHSIDSSIPFIEVNASRGKAIRAEPVSALYAQKLIHHVGTHPMLEEQMINMATNGYQGEGSPDRVDALVWAATELLVDIFPGMGVFEFYRRGAESQKTASTEKAPYSARPSGVAPVIAVVPSGLPRPENTISGVALRGPVGISAAFGILGDKYVPDASGTFIVREEDVVPLKAQGFTPVAAPPSGANGGGHPPH